MQREVNKKGRNRFTGLRYKGLRFNLNIIPTHICIIYEVDGLPTGARLIFADEPMSSVRQGLDEYISKLSFHEKLNAGVNPKFL